MFGALNQHFCILMMSMGIDRYFSLAFPHKYAGLFSAKVSLLLEQSTMMMDGFEKGLQKISLWYPRIDRSPGPGQMFFF